MQRSITILIVSAAIAAVVSAMPPDRAPPAPRDATTYPHIDPAPCVPAAASDDADRIIAVCGALIDNEKTLRPDRAKALIARARAYDRTDQIDRAISDYDTALRFDPTLSDVFTPRVNLGRGRGDRPRALADFGAAIKLNPQHEAARANYKSLAQELERLGAQMAIKKPGPPLNSGPPSKPSPPLK